MRAIVIFSIIGSITFLVWGFISRDAAFIASLSFIGIGILMLIIGEIAKLYLKRKERQCE